MPLGICHEHHGGAGDCVGGLHGFAERGDEGAGNDAGGGPRRREGVDADGEFVFVFEGCVEGAQEAEDTVLGDGVVGGCEAGEAFVVVSSFG